MRDGRLLVSGQTCWRVEHADRVACIVDAQDYFRAVKAAMLRARRRILLIGWDFDTRMLMERGGKTLPGPNPLGTLLRYLVRIRPDLEIHLLRSNVRLVSAFESMWGAVTPVALMNRLSSDRLQFAVDGVHPLGAVPHQKIVVVDDAIAFCGGMDLTVDRWDTREHLERNEFRKNVGRVYGPRHDVAAAVDGAAAAALAEHARERWLTATGVQLEPVAATHVVWPRGLEPTMRDVRVGIARTLPELPEHTEVREVEALNLAALAVADRSIYLENQYLASRKIVDVLAVRLREPAGPEVVIVLPRHSESVLEEQSMDSARYRLLHLLWKADKHGRLGVYWPVAGPETGVYIHSKVMVIDDQLLRIGSSNLNNRSLGFDKECDLAFEAADDAQRSAITEFRDGLIAEHLGVDPGEFARSVEQHGSLVAAIEQARGQGRTLTPFTADTIAGEGSLLAENDLMDPDRVPQSFVRSLQRWIARMND
ncbi:phospholipase D/transphosphatidylase [Mycolicibacterium murale]|jgi:phosphatidylserine/phosphatidylglycerophosphate/cardiolipin synthase-like enzyme|uniref:Phospholipase D/transphosphatidylase n=1 Tax=Mycolicibacterium murale TaxID=182220 RepID=A0A7I9WHJ0_9MYCO|nr:phospholipase D-like domain-containing protein [Mycolicibacterium murale]MCV7182544.1 phospholipase [Mycolicibacterium murale]GFG56768.1 phospholipase D/transphosphatidylase [Mycolicibacterium murale]